MFLCWGVGKLLSASHSQLCAGTDALALGAKRKLPAAESSGDGSALRRRTSAGGAVPGEPREPAPGAGSLFAMHCVDVDIGCGTA